MFFLWIKCLNYSLNTWSAKPRHKELLTMNINKYLKKKLPWNFFLQNPQMAIFLECISPLISVFQCLII